MMLRNAAFTLLYFLSSEQCMLQLKSCNVKLGMSKKDVQTILGNPPIASSGGPPGGFYSVYTYDRICIAFDSNGLVKKINR